MADDLHGVIVYITLPVILVLLGWIIFYLIEIRSILKDIRNRMKNKDKK